MCRVLAYLGAPVLLEEILHKPSVSFVNQTHQASLLHRLNLAGSGLLAWDARSDAPNVPFAHRTTQLAIYDRNLLALAKKVKATCMLAHLRGVAYDTTANISEANLHPFQFDGARLALAHNGQLARFEETKWGLVPHIAPSLLRSIRGSTDSEWLYALVLSQLQDPFADLSTSDMSRALGRAFSIVGKVRRDLGIRTFSPMNVFLSDGNDILAACYTFDLRSREGLPDDYHVPDESVLRIWYSLGHSYGLHDGEWRLLQEGGDPTSCIIASEPLTRDHASWCEVPMQHFVYVRRTEGAPHVELSPITLEALD
jgi:glutamine amidotransferase